MFVVGQSVLSLSPGALMKQTLREIIVAVKDFGIFLMNCLMNINDPVHIKPVITMASD